MGIIMRGGDEKRVELYIVFFFQAEDGIRDLVRSRGLGDVYKRQSVERISRFLNFVVSAPWLSSSAK